MITTWARRPRRRRRGALVVAALERPARPPGPLAAPRVAGRPRRARRPGVDLAGAPRPAAPIPPVAPPPDASASPAGGAAGRSTRCSSGASPTATATGSATSGPDAKLDYLNDGDPATTDDLGVGGLWLMPIAGRRATTATTSPTTDAVEPDYGTRDDLEALVAAAHERGIG